MNNSIRQIHDDLIALGVRPGGVLMVHSSLRSMGHVSGGAETVIQALMAALGDEGTLLMPALTYERTTPEHPSFDVRQTPANVGIIAETFRTRDGTRRSVHPTHSVCAAGPLTESLLANHIEDTTPCGPNSPFRKLPFHRGQILMLGCGLEPNTSMHAIEELVEPPYLYAPPIEYTIRLEDGSTLLKSYTPHNFKGWIQRYDRVEQLLSEPALRRGSIHSAQAFLIEAEPLWGIAEAEMQRDPLCMVQQA